jgi:membrane-bound lytic murein transglycosylase D
MKKFLLTTLSISWLISCQNPINKKPSNEALTQKPANITIDAAQTMAALEACFNIEDCKKTVDSELNEFLLENEIIFATDQIAFEEQGIDIVSKNVTLKSGLPSSQNVQLSSNYMNNELVKGAINEWLTWKRPQLINTWQYYQYLKDDMQPAFDKYNTDLPLILGIMAQESGGKVHSRSRAGAGGLFQLMPATAQRLGLAGKKGAYDLRFNPEDSAMAAAKYVEEQWQLYDGNKAKILAAYNSGENRFARLNKRYKNASLWDKNFYYELPRETRHYIPVVIAAMLIFQDPQQFNVDLEVLPSELVTVQLAEKTSLSEIAVCLGQAFRVDGWFRVLRNINSGVQADNSIKANADILIPKVLLPTFNEKCMDKDLMKLAQSFHDSDFKATQGLFRYRVKKGDSLSRIARKFSCTSKKEIARINQLKAPRYLIRAGKHLNIPQC